MGNTTMSKGRTGVFSKVFRMNSGSVSDMRRFAGDERRREYALEVSVWDMTLEKER